MGFELVENAIHEQIDDIPINQRQLTQYIIDYKYFLDQSDYAETTKKLKMNVIYSFCRAFEFRTPQIRQTKAICEVKNYERPITKKELRLMLDLSPIRDKAFLSIQATSGMASKEVRTLKVSEIIHMINTNLERNYYTLNEVLKDKEELSKHVYRIIRVRKKVQYRYITFIAPESMQHLFRYLESRTKRKNGFHITQNPNELVFVTRTGAPMKNDTVTGMYREMGKRAGFTSEPYQYRFWRSHNIRKYFYNIVEKIVGQVYADEWLGHVPSKVTRAYARRDDRMKEAYLKCLPYLSLETTEKSDSIRQKISNLENQIRNLSEEL